MEAAKNWPPAPGLPQAPPFDEELATRRFSMTRTLARWTKAGRAVADAPDRLAPRGSKGPKEGRFGVYSTPSAGTPASGGRYSKMAPATCRAFSVHYKFKG